MCDDENVLTTFELHDDGFKANDHVSIGFAASISIVEFVFITGCEVFGEVLFDFSILRPQVSMETIAE